MATIPSVITLTIPEGSSISNGQLLLANGIFAIAMLDAWTAAPMSFDVSLDSGATWLPLSDAQGNETTILISAGEIAQLSPSSWSGIPMIRIRSGTHSVPVVQSAGASIALFGLADTVAPNIPRRIIEASCYDFVGTFDPYWTTDSDVASFGLEFFLADNEYPSEVIEFDLAVVGSCGATDPDPSARVIGDPSIVGTYVSQRFGNWQPDVVQIIYRVQMVCRTTFNNVISLYAFVVVNQPPGLC